ncbi:excalibur calcium-binding domain-containing protein [Nocardia brasiliensis]|uniref:excalibur calcium-binding domain-containing protein n=1 Tax=Nocardia brasiliensis TaxID=37326 RepID=UPI0033D99F85
MTTTPRQRAAVILLIAGISLGSAACGRTPGLAPTVNPAPSSTSTSSAATTPTSTLAVTSSATAVPSPVAPSPTTVAAPHRFVPPAPAPPPPAPSPAPPAPSVYYPNCAAARAAGAAPLHRGAPGYRSALDRDGDGIACE